MKIESIRGLENKNIGRLSLKKTFNKAKSSIKSAASFVSNKLKTGAYYIPRTAFLGLVELNFHGLATKLLQAYNKNGNNIKFWKDFGGNRTTLMKVVRRGAKRKAILRDFENDINSIGVEPVSTGAAVASSTPILVKVVSVLSKAGIKTSDLKNIAKKGAADLAKKKAQALMNKRNRKSSSDSGAELPQSNIVPNTSSDVQNNESQETETKPSKKREKKILGMSKKTALIVGGSLLALGVGFGIYRATKGKSKGKKKK